MVYPVKPFGLTALAASTFPSFRAFFYSEMVLTGIDNDVFFFGSANFEGSLYINPGIRKIYADMSGAQVYHQSSFQRAIRCRAATAPADNRPVEIAEQYAGALFSATIYIFGSRPDLQHLKQRMLKPHLEKSTCLSRVWLEQGGSRLPTAVQIFPLSCVFFHIFSHLSLPRSPLHLVPSNLLPNIAPHSHLFSHTLCPLLDAADAVCLLTGIVF